MGIDDLRNRYVALFGVEPAEPGVTQELERALEVTLPDDFKRIASFYSGGMVGGISHHAIAVGGQATNILDETTRIKSTAGLPRSFLALAEPPESLILLDTAASEGTPAVLWIDANDIAQLGVAQKLREPDMWASYADFFAFLLEREEQERAESA